MHRRSLLLALLALSGLILIYFLQEPIAIVNQHQLEKLPENSLVTTARTVIKETPYTTYTVLILDTNISLHCACSNLKGNRIVATGYLNLFSRPYIEATNFVVQER